MLESDNKQRFSLRKLSIGLASVLIGISFFGANQIVKADTVDSVEQSAQVAQNTDKPVQNNADTQTQQNTSKELAKWTENANAQKQPEEQGQDNNLVKQSNTENQNTQEFNLTKIEKPQKSKVNGDLAESKIAEASISDGDGAKSKMQANGGFNEATWGKMDTSKWTGQIKQDILDNKLEINKSNIKIHKAGSNYVEFSYVNKPSVIFNLFKENGKYYLLVNNKKYTITSFKQLVSTINHYLLNSLSSNV